MTELVVNFRRLHMLVALGVVCAVVSLVSASSSPAFAATDSPADTASRTRIVFPDEFSDLDEVETSTSGHWDENVIRELESARQRYLKALGNIERKDTSTAAIEFESAIDILNSLALFPHIEENADFTDLAQSIIEDYEAYVQNIDNLGENSSVFILRERLFQEIEAGRTVVETIVTPTVAPPAVVPNTLIPLPYNEFVEKNISFLSATPHGRKFMKKCLERSGCWQDTLVRIAREEGVPEEIFYLAQMESGLNANALSSAKAVGMWQFIQSTGEMYDLNLTFWTDERRDPVKATRAAMHFLKDLYNDFGDWHLAMAAYNCGPGGVRRAIRKSGLEKPNFWEIREQLPRETRHYVPKYIAAAMINLNREQYGFGADSLNLHQCYSYEMFTVPDATNLSALASCAGITVDSLRVLNPELIRMCTPPGRPYKLKVPKGSVDGMSPRFALLSDDEKRPWLNHTVARGETLVGIARRYGVTATDVASVNGLTGYQAKVRKGTSLRIPIGGQSTSIASEAASNPAITAVAAPSRTAVVTRDQPARGTVSHVVVSGDNLYTISKRYGVRIADLRNWNNIPYDKDNVNVGETLIVARTDAATTPSVANNVERIRVARKIEHKVMKGESLASIATLYGTSVDRLRDLNHLGRKVQPKAGKSITVETSLSKSDIAAITRSAPSGTPKLHRVKKGESLGSIAALYSVDEQDLRRWNADVTEGTTVFSGTKLKVYGGSATSKGSEASTTAKKLPKNYKVRSGDSISEIADKFGVSVETLRRKNPALRKSTALRAGQSIRLQ